MAKRFKVVAHLPTSVELTKRTAKNDLRVEIETFDSPDSKGGTLVVGQGSIEWWPDHNSVNAHQCDWNRFIDLVTTLPQKRSSRKSR
jgi:hypothetical protein